MSLPSHSSASGRSHSLYLQVIIAVVTGILVGYFFPNIGASLRPLGDGFVKLIKMVIAPVIFLTVCTGIAGMADLKQTGRVAGKAMAYFLFFSTFALVVGMIVANVARPGAGLHIKPESLDAGSVASFVSDAHHPRDNGRGLHIWRNSSGSAGGHPVWYQSGQDGACGGKSADPVP